MSVAEHIDRAYLYLSKIPVIDEAVDAMAMARQELRAAYREAKETEKDGKSDG